MTSPAAAIVALGGGHGLAAVLTALRTCATEVTAVVTVADDGGSSGRLRNDLGILPPGDLRMAMAALCDDDPGGIGRAALLQYRFGPEGDLAGHPVGNVVLAALWMLEADQVRGLDRACALFGVRGRVLPMSTAPLQIEADVDFGDHRLEVVRGQASVAATAGLISQIRLDPPEPRACPEALAAVDAADWVIIGPGSWFTSVMPTLLVPELRRAVIDTRARRLLMLNLTAPPGETEGLSPSDHLAVLKSHAPELRVDVVLADTVLAADHPELEQAVAALGGRLVVAPIRRTDQPDAHDPRLVSDALRQVFNHEM